MKYKDPITGDFKEIRIRAIDELPVGSEIDVDDNTEIPAGWEETTDPNEYSTTEQRIGTWIDGKPLYRKTFTGTITTSSSMSFSHNISSLDQIVKMEGYVKRQSYWTSLLQYWDNMLQSIIQVDNSNIYVSYGNDYVNEKYNIIIEYTKTTD